jgi:hypothetical protein
LLVPTFDDDYFEPLEEDFSLFLEKRKKQPNYEKQIELKLEYEF